MIRIEKHIGINVIGQVQDVGQWRIFDGETLLGYLPYAEDSQVLPITNWPYERTDAICKELEACRALAGSPSKVIPPMTSLRDVMQALAVQQQQEEDEDE